MARGLLELLPYLLRMVSSNFKKNRTHSFNTSKHCGLSPVKNWENCMIPWCVWNALRHHAMAPSLQELFEDSLQMGIKPRNLQNPSANTYEKLKNCMIPISMPIKCFEAPSNGIEPTRTLRWLTKDGSMELCKKRGIGALAPTKLMG